MMMSIDGARQDSNDLRRVVALNEEIKAVVDISRGLGLEAINAMLVSRRAGESVKGFGVVSTELRAFSGRLATMMASLSADIAGLVQGVADLSREDRQYRALAEAHKTCDDCRGLEAALTRFNSARVRAATDNRQAWARAHLGLLRSLKLCDNGRALARGAKIEAVYGGNMSGELGQAGLAIERTIERIRDRLLVGAEIAGALL